jgi:hypothetical protein
MFGNLGALLKLVAQLAPLLTWLKDNQATVATIIAVLKQLAGAFAAKPQEVSAVMRLSIGMSHDDLRAALRNTLPVLTDWAKRTSWGADDILVNVLEFAVENDAIFDWIFAVFGGQEVITSELVAQAAAEVGAGPSVPA